MPRQFNYPADDLVSRQAVLVALRDYEVDRLGLDDEEPETAADVCREVLMDIVEELPSARKGAA